MSSRRGAFADDHEDRDRIAAIARRRGSRILGKELSGGEVLRLHGDTPLDVRCARAIGARCLAVTTGGHPLAELGALVHQIGRPVGPSRPMKAVSKLEA